MNIPIRTTHFLLHKFSIHQVCFCLYVVFTSNESFKWGFPGGSAGKESACNAGDLGPIPGLGRFPGGGWQPTPVFLLRESHGQMRLAGYSP